MSSEHPRHGYFDTALNARWRDDVHEWELNEPLVYVDPSGHEHIASAGTLTDLASIPLPLRSFAISEYRTRRASVIHDMLYREGIVPRRWADAIFYHALRAAYVNAWSAWIYWLAVRLFGWRAYRKENQ